MISFKKINIFFVLLLLLFPMIPIIPTVSAAPIQGTNDKIDVLYIGYVGAQMIHINSDMYDQMHYKDDFSIHTVIIDWMVGYDNDLDDYDLTTFDIVIVDMTMYDLFGDLDVLEDAHDNGTLLVSVANDYMGSTSVPDFFDFRDNADLTTSTAYPRETIEIFFEMYEDANSYSDEPGKYEIIQYDYAENMLMFLAEAKNEKTGEFASIVDIWEQNKIKLAYIGYTGQENWGKVNQYSSFMNVTFLKDPHTDIGRIAIENFGNSGGFRDVDFILFYMIMGSTCDAIDEGIALNENKLETVANTGVTPVYMISSLPTDYAIEIDLEYSLTRTEGDTNPQILVFAAQKYEKENAATQITKDWVLKTPGLLYGIYHPNLPQLKYETLDDYLVDYSVFGYDPNQPTVGIWFHKSYFTDGRVDIIDDLIADLESKNVNVIAGFDIFMDTTAGNPMMKYFSQNGQVIIGSAISIKDFTLYYNDYETGIEWLEELNVTVLKAVVAATGSSAHGIPKDMLIYSTVSPARDGMNDFIILGNVEENGPVTYHEQKDWLANRAIKWAILNEKDNADKKIALLYYNYPPGKDNIGANYLNVMRSLGGDVNGNGGVIREMIDAGYTISFDRLPINENELTEDTLLDLVLSQGINVGSYAPGVLDDLVKERGTVSDADWWGATLLPVETYKVWFDGIVNETIKNSIISEWGEPWDYSKKIDPDLSGMIWEDENGNRFIVIPAIRFGNLWLTPQPDRALATDKAAAYHSGDLPPTHQYVAYYLWLNYEFEADAIINFGTHGTHEWLPGEPYGLNADDDLAPILLKDLPNIYPYIVANVGEGLTAKYRGNALIIDHMTPPMMRSNLDSNEDLRYLETEIQAYLIGQDSETNRLRQAAIVDRMFEAGIHNIIGIDQHKPKINSGNPQSVTEEQVKDYLKGLNRAGFSNFLRNELYDYISSIKENNLPYGMHVFGRSMTEDQISAMLRSMWGPPFDQLIYENYYEANGYAGIPYEDEQMINDLVRDLANTNSPSAMKSIIQSTFAGSKYPSGADHERVVRFVIGPVMDIEGSNADAVIAKWKSLGVYDELKEEIIFGYYFYTTPPSDAEIEASVKNVIQYCLDHNSGVIDADLVNAALRIEFNTQTHQNRAVAGYLTGYGRLQYADQLRECGPSEMKSLMTALSGGYILPSAGNDPIQNKDAIPTGRNFYGIDPTKFPTKSAWEVGKSLADQLLADYYEKYGEFPNTVAFSRFGTEFIRDEGALEAMALYMMGVEPVWDINGNVDPKSVKVIPLSDLTITLSDGTVINRPRIDIAYVTAGMRDAFGDKLKLLNVGVRTVSNLNEPDEWNYVKVNTEFLKSNPATAAFAEMRTFANEPGNYEIGTGNLISASGSWDDPADITNLYLNKMGFVYGDDDTWGVSARALLEALLGKVDASVHSSSSNLYDTLDNDDFFQYFGALNLAVEHLSGKKPEIYVADTRNVGQSAQFNAGKIYTLKQYINIDMESRYKNEVWIKGMMESGYAGSTMFSEFVDNLFGWTVTTDAISFKDWSDVFDIYVDDKYDLGMADYFQDNPYAYQSITARMLESIRKEYLTAETPEQMEKLKEMEQRLVDEYMQSVIDNGVACCHHTCGNPRFDEFMKGQMAVLNVEPDKEQQYWQQVNQATYRDEPTLPSTAPSYSSGTGFGTAATLPGPSETGGDGAGYTSDTPSENRPADVSGYEMTESRVITNSIRDFLADPTFSSSSIAALFVIVALCAAVFYGFKKKKI